MNEDFIDLLRGLLTEGARFLVVGAHAMATHGVPRATGDIDIWIDADEANADRVFRALAQFGVSLGTLGISASDLSARDSVLQIGVPPRRIDLLTGVTGVDFKLAWERRIFVVLSGLDVPVLGREDLIANRKAAGRPKDLADVTLLEMQSR